MNLFSSTRMPFLLLFIATAGLLGFGYYLQFAQGLEPCPMCIFQRLCYFAAGLVALLAGMHGSRGGARRLYAALILLASLIGAGIAGRQSWLQHLPPEQVPECGPGLDFMLEMYPLWDVVTKALKGTGECAEVNWTFLNLSIAEWSLICFIAMTVWTLLIWFIRPAQPTLAFKLR